MNKVSITVEFMRNLKTCLEDFRIEGFERFCRKNSFETKSYKKTFVVDYGLKEIF